MSGSESERMLLRGDSRVTRFREGRPNRSPPTCLCIHVYTRDAFIISLGVIFYSERIIR